MRKPSESYLKLKKATDKILSGAGLVILHRYLPVLRLRSSWKMELLHRYFLSKSG